MAQNIHQAFTLRTPHGNVTFTPLGNNPPIPRGTPRKAMPVERWGKSWGAQIFVGLNIGDDEVFTAEQVRDAVLRIRTEQLERWGGSDIEHGASVKPQFGYWGKVRGEVRERSVAIQIESLSGESAEVDANGQVSGTFIDHISALIQQLAVEFEQDAVFAQIHRYGTVMETLAAKTEAR
ncbi:MAG: hypothetical protein GZ088_09405 [Acidipila sp.]|nr:hypothetical protein [Acidipila sp.]